MNATLAPVNTEAQDAAMFALHESAPELVKSLVTLIHIGESDEQILARCREFNQLPRIDSQIELTLPALRRFLP